MQLTSQGKDFIENNDKYKALNLNQLVIIEGPETIINNEVTSIGTIFIKNDEEHSVFIADFCSPYDLRVLQEKISEKVEVEYISELTLDFNHPEDKTQEMLIYMAYSNPDIRPVIFTGEAIVGDMKISIEDGKILVDGQETSPQKISKELIGCQDKEKEAVEKTIAPQVKEIKDIMNKIEVVESGMNHFITIPKIVTDSEEIDHKAIVFLDEKDARIKAQIIDHTETDNETTILSNFKIKDDLSWNEVRELIDILDIDANQHLQLGD